MQQNVDLDSWSGSNCADGELKRKLHFTIMDLFSGKIKKSYKAMCDNAVRLVDSGCIYLLFAINVTRSAATHDTLVLSIIGKVLVAGYWLLAAGSFLNQKPGVETYAHIQVVYEHRCRRRIHKTVPFRPIPFLWLTHIVLSH